MVTTVRRPRINCRYAAPAEITRDRIAAIALAHLLTMSDVVPLWLKPTRNALGILGDLYSEFTREQRARRWKPRRRNGPVHAVIAILPDGLLAQH